MTAVIAAEPLEYYYCRMKVVAYSVKPYERESLAKANQKKHDITLIFNSLSLETAVFAAGKQAVMVFSTDDVSAEVIDKLAGLGIKYITIRSANSDHINKEAARLYGIKLANAPDEKDIAAQSIRNLDLWEKDKCVGKACICAKACLR
ncbi:lactate dehydrogenase [Mucilaginibacter sp. McL0603]|uniref:lactate dehydrogenase n=1 Tax=Mucilaginibacter sp. McL0603 TaxID=3415670 RepID=UPI003CEC0385